MTLLDAAASGDRIKALTALRDLLAGQIDVCGSARDVAALSQRLMDVLAQIETASRAGAATEKGTGLDEFTKRRAARSPRATG